LEFFKNFAKTTSFTDTILKNYESKICIPLKPNNSLFYALM